MYCRYEAEKQYEWRKRVYNTYMTMGVSAQILLDDATYFGFSFDSADYEADLRKVVGLTTSKPRMWNCALSLLHSSETFDAN